jgi:two-component system nitrogen regulation sensor histidine kinase NtrY
MLNLKAEQIVGRDYKEVLNRDYLRIINEFLQDRYLVRKGSLKRQISLTVGNKTLPVLLSLNVLRDDKGKSLGVVAVLEDLSEIEKAQRMAAWREVARRIAHEVKNPLTPIQLSAQRLKRRYGATLSKEDSKVFEECTNMIVDQVEGLKRLVNEFSSYARLPAPNPSLSNIKQIIQESVNVYKEAQKAVAIVFHDSTDVPEIKVDREQMKRVMINLLDNALDAIDGRGQITIGLCYDQAQQIVTIEVADNGKGIPPEHKARVFEPYFSTKMHGTGLGLAIVNNIINDHNGSIRVQDEEPQGTRFIIELPVKV